MLWPGLLCIFCHVYLSSHSRFYVSMLCTSGISLDNNVWCIMMPYMFLRCKYGSALWQRGSEIRTSREERAGVSEKITSKIRPFLCDEALAGVKVQRHVLRLSSTEKQKPEQTQKHDTGAFLHSSVKSLGFRMCQERETQWIFKDIYEV